jgi:L-aminopeptidase/D-esterase-like protein
MQADLPEPTPALTQRASEHDMTKPGPLNLITDIDGLTVGHATDEDARTGVTIVLLENAWAASIDVRGGGPGVRESETLQPGNLVGRAHAIVLAGGSVFGLAAADGVAASLSARGIGLHLRTGDPHRACGGVARLGQRRQQALG